MEEFKQSGVPHCLYCADESQSTTSSLAPRALLLAGADVFDFILFYYFFFFYNKGNEALEIAQKGGGSPPMVRLEGL